MNLKMTQLATHLLFSAVAVTAAATACVTVNVNFPEAAVQQATDDYVRDLYRAKEKGRPTAPQEPHTNQPSGKPSKTTSFDFSLVTSAYADASETAAFSVKSEKAFTIRDRLAGRLDKILAQKRSGNLGETNDGLLTLEHSGGALLKPLLKKQLEPLVVGENKDRMELYDEVLASNGISKHRVKDIQKSFARSFQSESPSGTWVQDTDGKWAQKP